VWTELKRLDEMRVDGEPDPVKEASDLLGFLEDRRTFEPTDTAKGGQNSNLSKRTRIGPMSSPQVEAQG
jgi:hypothetical protein